MDNIRHLAKAGVAVSKEKLMEIKKTVVLEGYVEKLSSKGSWQRRYFVLTGESLSYFDKKGGKLAFSVEVSTIKDVSRGLGNEIIIEFMNEEKYKLKPLTDKEVKQWLTSIREGVTALSRRGTSTSVSDLNLKASEAASIIDWRGVEVVIQGKSYIYRKMSPEVINLYDPESYMKALVTPGLMPTLVRTVFQEELTKENEVKVEKISQLDDVQLVINAAEDERKRRMSLIVENEEEEKKSRRHSQVQALILQKGEQDRRVNELSTAGVAPSTPSREIIALAEEERKRRISFDSKDPDRENGLSSRLELVKDEIKSITTPMSPRLIKEASSARTPASIKAAQVNNDVVNVPLMVLPPSMSSKTDTVKSLVTPDPLEHAALTRPIVPTSVSRRPSKQSRPSLKTEGDTLIGKEIEIEDKKLVVNTAIVTPAEMDVKPVEVLDTPKRQALEKVQRDSIYYALAQETAERALRRRTAENVDFIKSKKTPGDNLLQLRQEIEEAEARSKAKEEQDLIAKNFFDEAAKRTLEQKLADEGKVENDKKAMDERVKEEFISTKNIVVDKVNDLKNTFLSATKILNKKDTHQEAPKEKSPVVDGNDKEKRSAGQSLKDAFFAGTKIVTAVVHKDPKTPSMTSPEPSNTTTISHPPLSPGILEVAQTSVLELEPEKERKLSAIPEDKKKKAEIPPVNKAALLKKEIRNIKGSGGIPVGWIPTEKRDSKTVDSPPPAPSSLEHMSLERPVLPPSTGRRPSNKTRPTFDEEKDITAVANGTLSASEIKPGGLNVSNDIPVMKSEQLPPVSDVKPLTVIPPVAPSLITEVKKEEPVTDIKKPSTTITPPVAEVKKMEPVAVPNVAAATDIKKPITTVTQPVPEVKKMEPVAVPNVAAATDIKKPSSTITQPVPEVKKIEPVTVPNVTDIKKPSTTVTPPVAEVKKIEPVSVATTGKPIGAVTSPPQALPAMESTEHRKGSGTPPTNLKDFLKSVPPSTAETSKDKSHGTTPPLVNKPSINKEINSTPAPSHAGEEKVKKQTVSQSLKDAFFGGTKIAHKDGPPVSTAPVPTVPVTAPVSVPAATVIPVISIKETVKTTTSLPVVPPPSTTSLPPSVTVNEVKIVAQGLGEEKRMSTKVETQASVSHDTKITPSIPSKVLVLIQNIESNNLKMNLSNEIRDAFNLKPTISSQDKYIHAKINVSYSPCEDTNINFDVSNINHKFKHYIYEGSKLPLLKGKKDSIEIEKLKGIWKTALIRSPAIKKSPLEKIRDAAKTIKDLTSPPPPPPSNDPITNNTIIDPVRFSSGIQDEDEEEKFVYVFNKTRYIKDIGDKKVAIEKPTGEWRFL